MKKSFMIVATIIGVILLGNVLIVSAQGGPGNQPMGPGMMRGRGGEGWMQDVMMADGGPHEQAWTAVAERLGMTYDELNAALQSGQTIAEIAAAQGVSLDELREIAREAMSNALADLVEQGVITQEQADWMLEHMQSMPMFNFGAGGCHNGQPGGMMHGWDRSPRWNPTNTNQG